ncbi:hypothetical protein TSOC_010148 [Tetrabaena socialis]|uniref:Uncharacterized protein n=1 Tax=Tetrabaena socialis TaxID=47790 RepID=A0A2J7ZU17_9CHLO|nr:hypothetical protein TSOC_010148 [Tetrabaena socialis]|eukprot:PNH03767.1 hypothetical protein TSOC_010148 [Tetrabaena socialis]
MGPGAAAATSAGGAAVSVAAAPTVPAPVGGEYTSAAATDTISTMSSSLARQQAGPRAGFWTDEFKPGRAAVSPASGGSTAAVSAPPYTQPVSRPAALGVVAEEDHRIIVVAAYGPAAQPPYGIQDGEGVGPLVDQVSDQDEVVAGGAEAELLQQAEELRGTVAVAWGQRRTDDDQAPRLELVWLDALVDDCGDGAAVRCARAAKAGLQQAAHELDDERNGD